MNSKTGSTWTEVDEQKYLENKKIVEDFLRPIDNLIEKISHIEEELETQSKRRRKLLEELRELQDD